MHLGVCLNACLRLTSFVDLQHFLSACPCIVEMALRTSLVMHTLTLYLETSMTWCACCNDFILMALGVGLCGCLVDALPLSTPPSSKP